MERNGLGAVLLAAGLSSRMGDFKPLLPVEGLPLIENAIRTLRGGGAAHIFVITGHRADELRPLLRELGATEVHNPHYARTDMFFSARLGLRAGMAVCDRLLIQPADVALFRSHSVRAMAELQRKTGADLVVPLCRGEKGHPVLLSQRCVDHVLAYDGEGGLRGAFDSFAGHRRSVVLPDPGILMDADRPEDYEKLKAYAPCRRIPDRAGCMDILAWQAVPANVVAHCQAVAALATRLGDAWNRSTGAGLDLALVQAGALLHDMAKGKPHHADWGRAVLLELGCPDVAEVVGSHMCLPAGGSAQIDERALVYYADKRLKGAGVVTLEERFAPSKERFAHDPDALAGVEERLQAAMDIENILHGAGIPLP